ncbi:MAG TPA: phosphoribosylanthranilate isomerase [Woeseiaceae bacterium]|nr:phosphoribosylanthranilate isomerase [Woeseiaceae bacterium]
MKPFVKICGLRHAATVEAAVAAGADAVGFVFAPSVRRVTAREAAVAANRVPRQVLRVAVMLHPTVEEWREVETIFCPDVLQTDASDFDYLDVPPEIARWPVLREGRVNPEALPGTFVYEGAASGRGERVDWHTAAELAKRGRMLLAGGLDPGNVAQAIADVAPWGVDVSSAVESAPGIKDPHLIHAFIAAAKGSDQRELLKYE